MRQLLAACVLAALVVPGGALAATFSADPGSLGAIPDGPGSCGTVGSPLDVTFQVSGLANKVTSVAVTFDLDHHDAVGDLDAALLGPGGTPAHTLFARTGVVSVPTCSGYLSNVEGPYTFSDEPAGANWWAVAAITADVAVIPAGTYRTSTSGGVAGGGGATTSMLTAFAGVANPNGTWTLRFGDEFVGLTASVLSASLTITAKDTIAPKTSFTKKPPLRTSSRQATFKLKSSEAGSTFLCKLDLQAFRRCSSPKTISVGLGPHTFQVKARDKAGNVDKTPEKCTWRVVRAS